MRISDWSSDVCSSDLSTLFFILALSLTTVADVLVIIAAAPLTAAVFGWIFLGEGVPLRTWVAIALTLAGIALLVSEDLGSGSLLGDLAAVVTALCIGGTFVIAQIGRASCRDRVCQYV